MNISTLRIRVLILLVALTALLVACGGDDEPEVVEPTAVPPTAEPVAEEPTAEPVAEEPTAEPVAEEPTAEPAASGSVSTLEGVKSAVIQIEAQGTFVDPEFGTQYNAAGRGSGFIIDPSGIAVTNNHVVTGAALIKVWVGGEDEPRNAKILGVSECSDLAIIDIDGDGFPYLEWYEDEISVGQDVYAAGFPLGDPEYTLTRGIVSKAATGGESDWSSVDNVIMHDATINPGNSGGALVTPDGKVLAVNYAGNSSTNQYFSITYKEALPVIEKLRAGEDYTSIGINGRAVLNQDNGLSGIWVSSVKSGSPAAQAGVVGGDIVTSIEGLILATDGTMADYCDILRSHNYDDVLKIEVLRYATEEVLDGQLNGDKLEQKFSFAEELEEDVADTGGDTTATNSEYVSVTDDSGALRMSVPSSWGQTDGSAWVSDSGDVLGVSLRAAPNLNDFLSSWSTPGVIFNASSDLGTSTTDILDLIDYSDSCTYDSRNEYSDELYTGQYDVWEECGDTGTIGLVLVVTPADDSFIALVMVQIVSDADLDALDTILSSFQVVVE